MSTQMIDILNLSTQKHQQIYFSALLKQRMIFLWTWRIFLLEISQWIMCAMTSCLRILVSFTPSWQYDRRILHAKYKNTYPITKDEKRIILLSQKDSKGISDQPKLESLVSQGIFLQIKAQKTMALKGTQKEESIQIQCNP